MSDYDLLKKEDLDIYLDDDFSKNEYNRKFSMFDSFLSLGLLSFACCLILGFLEVIGGVAIVLVILSFIVVAISGIGKNLAKYNSRPNCNNCHAVMKRYEYTDGHDRDINGVVFICHSCNRKFIDFKPTSTST